MLCYAEKACKWIIKYPRFMLSMLQMERKDKYVILFFKEHKTFSRHLGCLDDI